MLYDLHGPNYLICLQTIFLPDLHQRRSVLNSASQSRTGTAPLPSISHRLRYNATVNSTITLVIQNIAWDLTQYIHLRIILCSLYGVTQLSKQVPLPPSLLNQKFLLFAHIVNFQSTPSVSNTAPCGFVEYFLLEAVYCFSILQVSEALLLFSVISKS